MQLAFVLLSSPDHPTAHAVCEAWAKLFPDADPWQPGGGESDAGLLVERGPRHVMAALAPAPVPNREADEAARFSVSAMGPWELAEHTAHLVVTMMGEESEQSPLDELQEFTQVLAAVTSACGNAVGVYYGNGHVTHSPEFFIDVATTLDQPMMLWSGVSVAGDEQRLSLLSLGMEQFDLPELLLTAPRGSGNEAMEFFYNILLYVAGRGEPLPDGDTVGRDADERLRVRYEPSPINPEARVWCIDLPG